MTKKTRSYGTLAPWKEIITTNDVVIESVDIASEWGIAIVRRYKTRNQVRNTVSYVGVVTYKNHVSDMHFDRLTDAVKFCRSPYRPIASSDYWHGTEIAKGTFNTSALLLASMERRSNLVALINTYNEASNPSVPRTDSEHAIERSRAKTALGSIRRNYIEGSDYKELSNGALWPMNSEVR